MDCPGGDWLPQDLILEELMKKKDILELFKHIPNEADLVFNVERILKSELTKEISGYRVTLNVVHDNGALEYNVISFDINLSSSARKDPNPDTIDIITRI